MIIPAAIRYPAFALAGLGLAFMVMRPGEQQANVSEIGYPVERQELTNEMAELQRNIRAVENNPSVQVAPGKSAAAQKIVIRPGIHDKHHQH